MSALSPVYSANGVPDDSGPWNALAIDVSATDALFTASPVRGLYIGVTGDVTVDMASTGTNITFKSVAVGYLAGHFSKVYTTGTTATNILAVW